MHSLLQYKTDLQVVHGLRGLDSGSSSALLHWAQCFVSDRRCVSGKCEKKGDVVSFWQLRNFGQNVPCAGAALEELLASG